MTLTNATTPDKALQTPREDIVWAVDVAKQLTGTQTPTAVVTSLSGPTGAVALQDAPLVNGTRIEQRIRAILTKGDYRLSVRHTPSGTTNILESVLRIICP